MLPSQTEYKKLIHQNDTLKEEDQNKVLLFENYIKRSKENSPYISEENLNIIENYEKEITFLESLKEKNQNEKETIKRSHSILTTLSKEEQIIKEKQKTEELNKKRQTNSGYLNGVILIYITLNLALLIVGIMIKSLK